MSAREWQEKFSSIVKQTESNLDRVKQRLSSAKLSNSLPLDVLSDFAAPGQMSRTVSNYPQLENFNSSLALQRLNPSENHGSSMIMSLPLHSMEKMDENKYIPLHESASVIALLQEKIEGQHKLIEQCLKYVKTSEEAKESFQKDLQQLKEELRSVRSLSTRKETDYGMEQSVDKVRQEMKNESRAMSQKYNAVRNHLEETVTSMERRNSTLMETMADMQKCTRGDIESLRIHMDAIENRLLKAERGLSQLSLTDPKSSQLHDRDAVLKNSWSPERQSQNFRFKNSVSFVDDNQMQRSLKTGNGPSHIDEIRNSFKELQRKLSSLETEIVSDSELTSPVSRRNKHRVKRVVSNSTLSPSTSDIDLSTATDLVTTSYNVEGKSVGTFSFDPNLTLASDLSSEEDLTLDDL